MLMMLRMSAARAEDCVEWRQAPGERRDVHTDSRPGVELARHTERRHWLVATQWLGQSAR